MWLISCLLLGVFLADLIESKPCLSSFIPAYTVSNILSAEISDMKTIATVNQLFECQCEISIMSDVILVHSVHSVYKCFGPEVWHSETDSILTKEVSSFNYLSLISDPTKNANCASPSSSPSGVKNPDLLAWDAKVVLLEVDYTKKILYAAVNLITNYFVKKDLLGNPKMSSRTVFCKSMEGQTQVGAETCGLIDSKQVQPFDVKDSAIYSASLNYLSLMENSIAADRVVHWHSAQAYSYFRSVFYKFKSMTYQMTIVDEMASIIKNAYGKIDKFATKFVNVRGKLNPFLDEVPIALLEMSKAESWRKEVHARAILRSIFMRHFSYDYNLHLSTSVIFLAQELYANIYPISKDEANKDLIVTFKETLLTESFWISEMVGFRKMKNKFDVDSVSICKSIEVLRTISSESDIGKIVGNINLLIDEWKAANNEADENIRESDEDERGIILDEVMLFAVDNSKIFQFDKLKGDMTEKENMVESQMEDPTEFDLELGEDDHIAAITSFKNNDPTKKKVIFERTGRKMYFKEKISKLRSLTWHKRK